MRHLPGRFAVALLFAGAVSLPAAPPVMAQPIPGTSCNLFPANSILNADISSLPVNALSATWTSNMTQHSNLHPDLGTVAQQYGMPLNLAPPPASGLTPTFLYNTESDHPAEGYPIDQNTLIEGGPGASSGSDRHALTLNKNLCKLYEIYNLQNITGPTASAGSGAAWDLSSNAMRPDTWTSADAAGLPMTPLLLRPDEILAGSITHAIRFTAHCSNGYMWPGSHNAATCGSTSPPMGARFRLRAGFDISGFSANTRVVLRAFQHYGLILADNGSDWFVSGTTDDWWGTTPGDAVVNELKTIPANQFDAIDESGLQVGANSYAALQPVTSYPSGVYTALTPNRLLDTRGNGGTLGPGHTVDIAVGGTSGVPANATAVILNVTAVRESTAGFFTVLPTGAALPTASNLNWVAGETVPNLVSVGLGIGGKVTIYNGLGTADAVVDLQGYFAPSGGGTAGQFVPIVPVRITDTRAGSGQANAGMRLSAGGTLNVQVTGAGGGAIPLTGVSAVVLNTTATNTSTAGYFTVYPKGVSLPLASNLNWTAGVTVPNRVVVPVGTGGVVSFYNGIGSADVVVDVNGYFTDGTGSGAAFNPLVPARILDTRYSTPVVAPTPAVLTVAGSGGVPTMGSGSPPKAVVLNVTVARPTTASFLTVWPAPPPAPTASDLNFVGGQVVPNLVVVKLSAGGQIDILNGYGSTDVIVDVVGWYG